MFNSLVSIGRKAYNGAKSFIGSALGGASNLVGKMGDVSNWLNDILNVARDYPIVGDVAQNLLDNQIYKDVRELIHDAETVVDQAGRHYTDFIDQIESVPDNGLFRIDAGVN